MCEEDEQREHLVKRLGEKVKGPSHLPFSPSLLTRCSLFLLLLGEKCQTQFDSCRHKMYVCTDKSLGDAIICRR